MSSLLAELLSKAGEKATSDMYTAIPAVVVSVVNGFEGLLINAKPKLLVRDRSGEVSERSTILNVPVQMPSTKRSAITYPVAAGDDVLLIFSMQGIDSWKRHNERTSVEPLDFRKYSMRDCFAITGIFPVGNSVNSQANRSLPHNTDDLVVSHNLKGNETEVRLLGGGGIVINTQQNVEVNCTNLSANTTNTTVNATSATVNSDTFSVNATTASISASSLTLGVGSISAGGEGGGDAGASYNGTLDIQGAFSVNGVDYTTFYNKFLSHTHGNGNNGSDTTAPNNI